jgi:hypothetical protein
MQKLEKKPNFGMKFVCFETDSMTYSRTNKKHNKMRIRQIRIGRALAALGESSGRGFRQESQKFVEFVKFVVEKISAF